MGEPAILTEAERRETRELAAAWTLHDRIARASIYLARPDVATVLGWVVALGFEVMPEKGFGAL